MIQTAFILLIIGSMELIGSLIVGLQSDSDARSRANLLAQWSMATALLAIGILLIEK